VKYLKHKEKGFLIPYTVSMESDAWEVVEDPPAAEPEPAPAPAPVRSGSRLKPAE